MTDQFNLPDYEKLVSCPYNKAHQVVQHRLGKHIIKCARSHGGAGFKECQFNWTHVFPVSEIAEHEADCPDRLMLEKCLMAEQPRRIEKLDSQQASSSSRQLVVGGDNWDDLPAVDTYNPRMACRTRDVVIDIKHGLPSQRKTRRLKEHDRLTDIRAQKKSTE